MKELRFEWDPTKSTANQGKHGISFEEATTVFYDNRAIEFYDDEKSEWEGGPVPPSRDQCQAAPTHDMPLL